MSTSTSKTPWTAADTPLYGGALCLDYANTVDRGADDEPWRPATSDVLSTRDSLGIWAARMGIPAPRRSPARELREARHLRDAVYRGFSAIARGRTPSRDDLETIRRTYAAGVRAGALAPGADGWSWSWPAEEPRAVRFAVAADAVALLQDPDRLTRVSRCPGAHCGWLFANASGRRRWCAMSACGSREKSRRAYRRRTGA
jgi:predicted RNA-binding Zn ribbon-like protein